MSDTTKEPGCGWTTQAIWKQLVDMSEKQYADELKKFPQISTKKRMDLIAGFRDGLRAAVKHLEGMGVLVVVDSFVSRDDKSQESDET